MTASAVRGLSLRGDSDRADVSAFLARAARVDDSGVFRMKQRPDGSVGLWARTGFDVLATRSVFGTVEPTDAVAEVATVRASITAGDDPLSIGFALPASWQGALPGSDGYRHLDDIPAREVIALARRGAQVARDDSGALGPAHSLLDQQVLEVSSDDSADAATVSMRAVFALTSMGFVRDRFGHEITEESPLDSIDPDEPVRIRKSAAWVRIDARYGSVYQRSSTLNVSVL